MKSLIKDQTNEESLNISGKQLIETKNENVGLF